MVNKEKIKKSFLFTISPPFFCEVWQPPNLLNIPKIIIPNICIDYNLFYKQKATILYLKKLFVFTQIVLFYNNINYFFRNSYYFNNFYTI